MFSGSQEYASGMKVVMAWKGDGENAFRSRRGEEGRDGRQAEAMFYEH